MIRFELKSFGKKAEDLSHQKKWRSCHISSGRHYFCPI